LQASVARFKLSSQIGRAVPTNDGFLVAI